MFTISFVFILLLVEDTRSEKQGIEIEYKNGIKETEWSMKNIK
jgi:hypothetical protein